MVDRSRSLSADIHVGVVCGVGAAAAAWTIAGSPGLLEASCLAFVILAALASNLGSNREPPLRSFARSAAVGAALLVHGLGAALLVAQLVTARAWLASRTTRGPLFLLGLLHALAVSAMRVLVPGLAYLALGGTAPIRFDPDSIPALLGALAASWATARTLAGLGRPLPLESTSRRAGLPDAWPALATEAAAALGALGVAGVHAIPGSGPWLLLLPAAGLFLASGQGLDRRSIAPRPAPSESARRAIAEALALASAARGRGDLAHLDRVEGLALDLAGEIGLPTAEREALSAAALLHEVDLLALPPAPDDGPGQVEPHPALGAEVLDALPLPDSTRAIVRHRAERWDGSGRPSGLVGESIPLGARILAAVEAFDEWTFAPGPRAGTDGALERLRAGAGTRFDPRVIEALERRIQTTLGSPWPESASRVSSHARGRGGSTRLRDAARELHTLYEIERSVGYRLDLSENLLLVLGKLAALVPHHTAAVYELVGETLRGRFALGAAAGPIEHLDLALDRLSARAVTERRTLAGGLGDGFDLVALAPDPRAAGLASALAAPLVAGDRVLGALTLYAGPERRFDAEDRRVVAAVAGHVAAALTRSDPRSASYLASLTDPSTGLPNARYLEICAAELATGGPLERGRWGLLVFRWLDFDTTCERCGIEQAMRTMGVLGRRIAEATTPREIVARFGTDLLVVLSTEGEPAALVERWAALLRVAEADPISGPSGPARVRLASAQASSPSDGRTLDALLGTLGGRLGGAAQDGARVVPFRAARSAGGV